MKVIVTKSYECSCGAVAEIILGEIRSKPDAVIGFATGSSPEGVYGILAEEYGKGNADFSRITAINLDEYVGLANGHPQSYHAFMHEKLFGKINIPPHSIYIPNGNGGEAELLRFKEILDTHPVDLQLLGVGHNGHIGFNEPSEEMNLNPHFVKLDKSTIEKNARFFDSSADVPATAITMGIGDILKAKKIVLLVSGDKIEVTRKLLCTETITPRIPCTMLRVHPNVTVVLEKSIADRAGYRVALPADFQ